MSSVSFAPSDATMLRLVSYLKKLPNGDRKSLRVPRVDTIMAPSAPYFEVTSWPDVRGDRRAWRALMGIFVEGPELHDPKVGLGKALWRLLGDDKRFLAFVQAHDAVALSQTVRMGTRLMKTGCSFHFGQLATLVLDRHGEVAWQIRERVARDFYGR